VNLITIAPADYARDVLPQSRDLWADGRTFDDYVAEFHDVAGSSYGKRRFRTLGLHIDGIVATSLKRYERALRIGERTFDAIGIGAVFTPEPLRGRGYATAMLGMLLDHERAQGTDIAFLFTEIHPIFYERLGFITLPSRSISLRADNLPGTKLDAVPITDRDWTAVRRCFDALDRRRQVAFTRSPTVWEWQRIGARSRAHEGQRVELHVKRGRTTVAYVFGRRVPRVDTFVLDEFAYTGDEGFDAIPALVRCAAGDLRRIGGWLPPDIARAALPRGAVRRRTVGTLMIAPISVAARAAWQTIAPGILAADADLAWTADHV
jgi:GNAT superfamily N-acetyltransferase